MNITITPYDDDKVKVMIRYGSDCIVETVDSVSIDIDPVFKNVLDPNSQVSVWQSA